MRLPNVKHSTLLNLKNLSYMSDDEDLVHPAPPRSPQLYLGASSSFGLPLPRTTLMCMPRLRSIEDEQLSLQVYVKSKHATLRDFV